MYGFRDKEHRGNIHASIVRECIDDVLRARVQQDCDVGRKETGATSTKRGTDGDDKMNIPRSSLASISL